MNRYYTATVSLVMFSFAMGCPTTSCADDVVVEFNLDDDTLMQIQSNGNVGIGTQEPGRKLDVNGHVRLRSGPRTTAGIWLTDRSDVDEWFVGKGNFSPYPFGIYKDDWKMVVQDNGNVGIGTKKPGRKLDVNGHVRLRSGPTDNAGIWLTDRSDVDEWFVGKGNFSPYPFGIYKDDWKMVVQDNGNVGIGTKKPGRKLDVNGHVRLRSGPTDNAGIWLTDRSDVDEWFVGKGNFSPYPFGIYKDGWKMVVQDNGNVGIGTKKPGRKLDVNGHVRLRSGPTDNAGIWLTDRSDVDEWFVGKGNFSPYPFGIYKDGWKMVVQDNGNVGIGTKTPSPSHKLTVRGTFLLQSESSGENILELGEGLDYAEGFDVAAKDKITPGTVLIIDPDNPGKLKVSSEPYDTKVAGIVAGAKETESGIRLGAGQFDVDVAIAGRVYCNVDASAAEVQPGDLLTTSSITGFAMKAADNQRAQGSILGKAMETLGKGKKGEILVLVTLQ